MRHPDETLGAAVDRLRAADPRFRREAYAFVLLSLGIASQELPLDRRRDPLRRHLTGAELLRTIVRIARQEFGSMAPVVFHEWGLRTAADVGDLVFQLVECGQLSARPEDRREDFHGPDLMRLLSLPPTSGVPRA